jgi:hypothetical protein
MKGISVESDESGNIFLLSVLRALTDLGYEVMGCNVLYHQCSDNLWIMINRQAASEQDLINTDGIENNRIKLKFRIPPTDLKKAPIAPGVPTPPLP